MTNNNVSCFESKTSTYLTNLQNKKLQCKHKQMNKNRARDRETPNRTDLRGKAVEGGVGGSKRSTKGPVCMHIA